jgi:mannitol-specific phosphotransferase system IIBC component
LRIVSVLFVVAASLAAVTLIGTGLTGYRLPGQILFDAATWQRGEWAGRVLPLQVGLGIALLVAACVVGVHLGRRPFSGR